MLQSWPTAKYFLHHQNGNLDSRTYTISNQAIEFHGMPLCRCWRWWWKLHMLQQTTRSLHDVLWQEQHDTCPHSMRTLMCPYSLGSLLPLRCSAQSQKISQELLRNHPVPLYWIALVMNCMVLGCTNHPTLYECHHIAPQQLGSWGRGTACLQLDRCIWQQIGGEIWVSLAIDVSFNSLWWQVVGDVQGAKLGFRQSIKRWTD